MKFEVDNAELLFSAMFLLDGNMRLLVRGCVRAFFCSFKLTTAFPETIVYVWPPTDVPSTIYVSVCPVHLSVVTNMLLDVCHENRTFIWLAVVFQVGRYISFDAKASSNWYHWNGQFESIKFASAYLMARYVHAMRLYALC